MSDRHRRWIGHFLPQLDPSPCRIGRSIREPVDRPSHQAWKIGFDLGYPVLEKLTSWLTEWLEIFSLWWSDALRGVSDERFQPGGGVVAGV